jgi:hypothetical protein
MSFSSKTAPSRQEKIIASASLIIAACSGPFLFKAAGLADFPKLQVSHWVIAICYVAGMRLISQFILLRVMSLFTPSSR